MVTVSKTSYTRYTRITYEYQALSNISTTVTFCCRRASQTCIRSAVKPLAWGRQNFTACNAGVRFVTRIRVHTYVFSSSITFTTAVTITLAFSVDNAAAHRALSNLDNNFEHHPSLSCC